MKQIYLVALACGLLVLASALSGQSQKDGSAPRDSMNTQEAFAATGPPCATLGATGLSYGEGRLAGKGKCSCEIITGARVWGCNGRDQVDCEGQTCTYERLDLRTGEVIEKGNLECAWTPYYPS
jgi:hypothetical protein